MSKTVLITGCSSGIGRASAHAFLDDDWVVYATARDPDDIADLAEAGCETLALDVTDREACEAAVDAVLDAHGKLDCLVNNAGYGQYGPVEDVPTRLLERQFDVNVYGPHRLMLAALPAMRDEGDGTIVNVSSVAGRLTIPGGGPYSASKFALEALSDALRQEVASYGLDVVVVQPGPVATAFEERRIDELDRLDRTGAYEAIYEFLADTKLLGKQSPMASTPEDVATVILEAAASPDPQPRYQVGVVAELGVKGRYVPDSLRDRAFGLVERLL